MSDDNLTKKEPFLSKNGVLLGKLGLLIVVLYSALEWTSNNYRLGLDLMEGEKCLPYTAYIIDLNDKDIRKDDFFAFSSKGMGPFYRDGTQAIKIAAAMPGDLIAIDKNVRINHQKFGEMTHLKKGGRLYEMGKRVKDYQREEIVPEGKIFALATHPRSYDSRYWGYVTKQQVIGRAIPLF